MELSSLFLFRWNLVERTRVRRLFGRVFIDAHLAIRRSLMTALAIAFVGTLRQLMRL